jgi:hypothetical protein
VSKYFTAHKFTTSNFKIPQKVTHRQLLANPRPAHDNGTGALSQGGEGSEGSVGVNCGASVIPEAKPSGVTDVQQFGTPKVSLARRHIAAPARALDG